MNPVSIGQIQGTTLPLDIYIQDHKVLWLTRRKPVRIFSMIKKDGFTIDAMYKHSQLVDLTYGVEGYEVPKIPFDPVKHKKDRENYEVNTFKKKRPGTSKLDMKTDKACIYKMVKK